MRDPQVDGGLLSTVDDGLRCVVGCDLAVVEVEGALEGVFGGSDQGGEVAGPAGAMPPFAGPVGGGPWDFDEGADGERLVVVGPAALDVVEPLGGGVSDGGLVVGEGFLMFAAVAGEDRRVAAAGCESRSEAVRDGELVESQIDEVGHCVWSPRGWEGGRSVGSVPSA